MSARIFGLVLTVHGTEEDPFLHSQETGGVCVPTSGGGKNLPKVLCTSTPPRHLPRMLDSLGRIDLHYVILGPTHLGMILWVQ